MRRAHRRPIGEGDGAAGLELAEEGALRGGGGVVFGGLVFRWWCLLLAGRLVAANTALRTQRHRATQN